MPSATLQAEEKNTDKHRLGLPNLPFPLGTGAYLISVP